MQRSQFTVKNVLLVLLAVIVAGAVAVGWGLSELQTSGSSTIVIGAHLLAIL